MEKSGGESRSEDLVVVDKRILTESSAKIINLRKTTLISLNNLFAIMKSESKLNFNKIK